MKFRNPRATKTIEGRLPKKEDNFSDDRFYCDNIQNVFVRFDPYPDYIRVTFPSSSDTELKILYPDMERLAAKNDVIILDLLQAADNIEEVIETPKPGYSYFSDDLCYFIKYKKDAN